LKELIAMGGKKKPKGFPVAIAVSLTENRANLWILHSRKVTPGGTLKNAHRRSNLPELYKFHEGIVDLLRPHIKEGTRTVIMICPPKSVYFAEFMGHLTKHHGWLVRPNSPNVTSFSEFAGTAADLETMRELVNTEAFQLLLNEAYDTEGETLVELLEKRFKAPGMEEQFFYTLDQIEQLLVDGKTEAGYNVVGTDSTAEYLLFAENFYQRQKSHARVQRCIQLAKNQGFRVKILKEESEAGQKVASFGGVVCLIRKNKPIPKENPEDTEPPK
jgi:stalled ribosome rescue protein Dom34